MDQTYLEIASEDPVHMDKEKSAENAQEATKSEVKPKMRRQLRRHICSRHGLSHRSSYESFAIYFPKVLKNVHSGLSLSREAVSILDSFIKDIFERLVQEAVHLARVHKCVTLTEKELQAAVRMLLPQALAKHAEMEGTRALVLYNSRY